MYQANVNMDYCAYRLANNLEIIDDEGNVYSRPSQFRDMSVRVGNKYTTPDMSYLTPLKSENEEELHILLIDALLKKHNALI